MFKFMNPTDHGFECCWEEHDIETGRSIIIGQKVPEGAFWYAFFDIGKGPGELICAGEKYELIDALGIRTHYDRIFEKWTAKVGYKSVTMVAIARLALFVHSKVPGLEPQSVPPIPSLVAAPEA